MHKHNKQSGSGPGDAIGSSELIRTFQANLNGTLPFILLLLQIGSFYNSPRVIQLSIAVFESIQPISGSGVIAFSLA